MKPFLCFLLIINLAVGSAATAWAQEKGVPVIDAASSQVRWIGLLEGIRIICKDSRLVKINLYEDKMSYEDSLAARSALLPHLNLMAAKTYNREQSKMKFGDTAIPVSDLNSYSFGASAYQTLFDFGKSLSVYQASAQAHEAVKAHTEAVRRMAVLEFVVSYFNLLEIGKMMVVTEKEVESLSSYLKDMDHLFRQGAIVKNDLLPAQVKLADAKQKLIAARNAREVAVAHLNNLLSFSLDQQIAVSDLRAQKPEIPAIRAAWASAQDKRPEVSFYGSQIRASESIEHAKAVSNYPEAFVDGGYSYNENSYMVKENNATIRLGIKMDVFDGGQTQAETAKAALRHKQLKEQKEKMIEDIKFEVEDSYFGLKNACETVSVAQEALAQSAENVRANRAKYTAGTATSTDVLEAITQETRAQSNYYSADYELKRNYAKLMYAMGLDLTSIYEKAEQEVS